MLGNSSRTSRGVLIGVSFTVPFTLNIEALTQDQGASNLLVRLWHSGGRFIDIAVDPKFMWMFWLGVGVALGAISQSWLRKIEEQGRGRLGGPPLYYLRLEGRMLRWAIKYPMLRAISHDFDQDLVDFNAVLTQHYGFPPLPCTTFRDSEGLKATYEYLHRIAPFLNNDRLDVARTNARQLCAQVRTAAGSQHQQAGNDGAIRPDPTKH